MANNKLYTLRFVEVVNAFQHPTLQHPALQHTTHQMLVILMFTSRTPAHYLPSMVYTLNFVKFGFLF